MLRDTMPCYANSSCVRRFCIKSYSAAMCSNDDALFNVSWQSYFFAQVPSRHVDAAAPKVVQMHAVSVLCRALGT